MIRCPLFCCLATLLVAPLLEAADFDSALSLGKRTANLVYRDRIEVHWLPDGKALWYRVSTGVDRQEYVLVEVATGKRRTSPDIHSLGLPQQEAQRSSQTRVEMRKTKHTGGETTLKLVNTLDQDLDLFWINTEGKHVRYGGLRALSDREMSTFEGHVWLISSRTGEPLAVVQASALPVTLIIDGKGTSVQKPEPPTAAKPGVKSPDGKWSAAIEKGQVVLHDLSTSAKRMMPCDGRGLFHGPISWAPDSSVFAASRCEDVPQRRVTVVNSSPINQLQPRLLEFDYTKPGDGLPNPQLVLFPMGGKAMPVNKKLYAEPFTQTAHISVEWAPDSSECYFNYNQRGHQLYRIIAVQADTAEARPVVEEKSPTFIDYTQKTWRHWLPQTGELLWMSERDGWCHLWLYDAKSGRPKRQVTQGKWPVREVLHVDADKREVWFMASGLRSGEDPYHLHLCRVGLDGGTHQQLTTGDGNHRVSFSPDRSHFVDAWSRADLPPVHELRRSSDGRLVCMLETAQADALLAAGWTLPERFAAKGRDGVTDIHGIIIKPSHFDPAKKYPVVEQVYAGPHSAFVPKDFGRLLRQHELAELGFIVVQVDGMGTNHRGKAFHDVCWKNLKDAGFPDRIAWMRKAAQTRPWMDLKRVGIYGGSAGGQNAMRALLDHHDFYSVSVADCGCHDNRMDKIWWNEQWMGWPVDESYTRSSNVADAAKLKGHLLLFVGELDTNVDPASTMQVVGALQKAGKSFDFMPIIGTGHGAAETPYASRLRMEFLVRHLHPDSH